METIDKDKFCNYGIILFFYISAKSVPFNIRFLSDLHESDEEDEVVQNGFRLSYTLKSC